ncbi:MAG: serine/threonine protein kinase, partial [Isosphaeraceae bacterium]
TDRYANARDMAEDLRAFLDRPAPADASSILVHSSHSPTGEDQPGTPGPIGPGPRDSDQGPRRVIPKGLRSFDEHDAEFFLELLPGPRDREGLPESLRFWKSRIEATDPATAFRVGLIYGPSGCGKSSLVRAGLVPRLARHVLTVFLESAPEETETRLLKGLRRVCPDLPPRTGLVDALAAVRRGRILRAGQKVLLVLDQFEQWLHAHRGEENAELVAALRQCDGERLQAVVMVRDDFWMATTRFMDALEVALLEGRNMAAVDLFDPRHARKVLTAFGKAHDDLPERGSDISKDQILFIKQAVTGLTQDGKVIPVRLALFAEMVKGKPWTPAALRDGGGTRGVGVAFLNETFCSPLANPRHRAHRIAAQAVLKTLLPEFGSDLKGRMRPESKLREAAAYSDRPREFAELLQILDNELRLITPTDPDVSGDETVRTEAGARHYQLTHDYLVPALRDWLTLKQRETRRGRAELRLAERESHWSASPENRHLPSLREWLAIRVLTGKASWTEPQRGMMTRASTVHTLRTIGVTTTLLAMLWLGLDLRRRSEEEHQSTVAVGLARQAIKADLTKVDEIVRAMEPYRRWTDAVLRVALDTFPEDRPEHLNASLALLPVEPSAQLPYLRRRLLAATAAEFPVLRDQLSPYRSILIDSLWNALESSRPGEPGFLPAASALAEYDAESPRWETRCGEVARALVTVNQIFLGAWMEALRPVRGKLIPPLAVIFRDERSSESERNLATDLLAQYAQDQPSQIADLLMDAEPRAYAVLFPIAQARAERTLPLFRAEIAPAMTSVNASQTAEAARDRIAKRQARAAITLLRMGQAAEVVPLLRHSADPRLRSFIIHWLNPLGADPRALATELDRLPTIARPVREAGRSFTEAILFHRETSERRALIVALGTYGKEGLSKDAREPLAKKLLALYRDDPDGGIH